MNKKTIDTLAIIIVAAGSSTRLGQPKQLVSRGSGCLLRNIALLAGQLSDSVSCVFGYQAPLMVNQIKDLKVKYLINQNWNKGMGSSISAGVKQLDESIKGVLILLCDQWALNHQDLAGLIACWRMQPTKIVASSFESREDHHNVIGSPVIFPFSYFKQLTNLDNKGAKYLLEQNSDVVPYQLDNAKFDLDTPNDLEMFENQSSFA